MKENKVGFIRNPYTQRSHTKPSNKLRLKYKLIENPKLRDLIINVDEIPKENEKEVNSKKKKEK